MKKPVGPAPDIDGIEVVRPLGAGGFADVFLCHQPNLGNREVAVKIWREARNPAERAMLETFEREADTMATVSAHPFIVQVFRSGRARDGRPFLVMEYYPLGDYMERCRRAPLDVGEALRVGIQLASAVETAHRAGIFHYDIKPANVLTSRWKKPGLTDFGIAAVKGDGDDSSEFLSVPWASPEMLRGRPAGAATDVYSLAASVYTLLVARSPFEVRTDQDHQSMRGRIKEGRLPPIRRSDIHASVQESLHRTLSQAMHKDLEHRTSTAHGFALDLQRLEQELNFVETQLELEVTAPVDESLDIEDRTMARPVIIQPDLALTDAPGSLFDASTATDDRPATTEHRTDVGDSGAAVERDARTRQGIPLPPRADETVQHVLDEPAVEPQPAEAPPKSRTGVLIGVAALLVAVVVALFIMLGDNTASPPGNEGPQGNDDPFGSTDGDIVARPRPPTEIFVAAGPSDGRHTFTWPAPAYPAAYWVTVDDGPEDRVEVARYDTSGDCLAVRVERLSDQVLSDRSQTACATE